MVFPEASTWLTQLQAHDTALPVFISLRSKGKQLEGRDELASSKAGDSLHLHGKHFLEVMGLSDPATLENSCHLPSQGFLC